MTPPLSSARRSASLLFVSGQLALTDGRITGSDVATQTNLVIDAIERELATFGLDLTHVLKTGVWLVSQGDFPAFNTVNAARFRAPYPARSTVFCGLAFPDALVEIDVVAECL